MSRHNRAVEEAQNGTTAGDTASAGAADGVGSAGAPSVRTESVGQGPLPELPDAVPGFVAEAAAAVTEIAAAIPV